MTDYTTVKATADAMLALEVSKAGETDPAALAAIEAQVQAKRDELEAAGATSRAGHILADYAVALAHMPGEVQAPGAGEAAARLAFGEAGAAAFARGIARGLNGLRVAGQVFAAVAGNADLSQLYPEPAA